MTKRVREDPHPFRTTMSKSIKIIETEETPQSIALSSGAGHKFGGTKRAFAGNGASELQTPHLREIFGIVVGGHSMELVEKRQVPIDTTLENFHDVDCPMVTLTGKGENTVLRRSAFSNDGIWQEGMEIEVWGRWAEPKAAPKPDAPAQGGGAK